MKKWLMFSLLYCVLEANCGQKVYAHNALDNDGEIMKSFNENIFELAKANNNFRKELVTGKHSQVVLMSIPVGGEIGTEIHKVDQTLVFVSGNGQAILDGKTTQVGQYSLVFVPAGTEHNFKNSGDQELKLFTIYAPAQHKPGTIEKNKPESDDYD